TRTDPGGKGNHIRNITVVREDHLELARLGETFNPAWLRHVQDMRALRFMDWAFTNGSPQQGVADRPLPGDFTYVWRGVPLEVMVDLANQVGADPWFTVPHMADDALVRAMAEVVRDRLDPRLRAYVEYSNELWNFMFPQTQWALQQANARWGEDAAPDAWMQFAGMRAAQVMDIWSDVFADQAEERLVRVVATHTGWPGLEEGLLDAPLWRAEAAGNRAPVESFDAYAVTGYFGHEMGTDDFAPRILEWLDQGEDVTRREVTQALRTGSLKELTGEIFPYHGALAARHGMRMIMYEGGTHVAGLGEWTENRRLTDFFTSYNYSPEMAALYTELLAGWDAAGGTLFNAFVDVAPASRWGSWGHLRHLDDSNPRWDALMAYNASGGVDRETRAPGTFANGIIRHAPEGGGRIEAQHPRDLLMGGAGDDVLVATGCCVRMHGGAGQNVAVLPGAPEDYDFLWMGDVMLVSATAAPTQEMRLADIQRITFADAPDAVMELTPPAPETEG
ncbi:MAG: calcium-binding protein, partial [Rhodobacterales bacterium]|nr:calcium-binding protein [Rhodobacterales bacterium]